MAVFAHAQNGQIENGLAVGIHWRKAAKLGFGFLNCELFGNFRADAMDLVGGNAQRFKEVLPGDKVVALGIVRRDAAFVAEKEMDSAPIGVVGRNNGLVKAFGDASTRKSDEEFALARQRGNEAARGFGRKRAPTGKSEVVHSRNDTPQNRL